MLIKKEINISNKNQLEEFLSVGYKVNVENLKHTNKSFLLYDDVIVGRVTLWEKNNDNKKKLYFGNFFVLDNKYISNINEIIEDESKKINCELVIGPIDNNTWNRYRFVKKNVIESIKPFFLEIENDLKIVDEFIKLGYKEYSRYYSSIVDIKSKILEIKENLNTELIEGKYKFVLGSELEFDKLIKEIYEITVKSFKNNTLYEEVTYDEFVKTYYKIKDFIKLEYIYILYDEKTDNAISFLFAIPDYNDIINNGSTDTIIAKTLSVIPKYQGLGLGRYLIDKLTLDVYEKGFSRIIHAFMEENNVSKKISDKNANVIREYTLLYKGTI